MTMPSGFAAGWLLKAGAYAQAIQPQVDWLDRQAIANETLYTLLKLEWSEPVTDATIHRVMRAIVRRRVADHQRRITRGRRDRRREQALAGTDCADVGGGSLGQVLQQERAEQLRIVVAELPATQREIVEKRFFDGMAVHEIARERGTSAAAVTQMIERGLAQSAQAVGSTGVDRMTRLKAWLATAGLAGAIMAGAVGYQRWVDSRGPRAEIGMCGGLWLGKGKEGETLIGEFPIRNTGYEPLTFSIKAGCGCSRIEPSNGVVNSGETALIQVAMKLETPGANSSVMMSVRTNDSRQPRIDRLLTSRCVAAVVAEPAAVRLTLNPSEADASSIVRIYDDEGGAIQSEKILLSGLTAPLSAAVTSADGESVEIKIVAKSGIAYEANQWLTVTRVGHGDRKIPVILETRGRVQLSPCQLSLSSESSSARLLIWKQDGEPVGAVDVVDNPNSVAIRRLTAESSPGRTIFEVFGGVAQVSSDVLIRCDGQFLKFTVSQKTAH